MRRGAARSQLVIAAMASLSLLVACANEPAGRDVNCAAVLSYTEPVLTITGVRSADGAPAAEVVITRYRHDGVPSLQRLRWNVEMGTSWSPGVATTDSGLHANVSLGARGTVTCTVPCAFESDPGTVDLTVVARDGQRTALSIEVDYDDQRPGCGGAQAEGTDVELVLTSPRQQPGDKDGPSVDSSPEGAGR